VSGHSKPNPGWFKKGYDARRHVLSRAERQKGFFIASKKKLPSRVRAWLRKKIRNFYVERNRKRREGGA
jgi:hypothetical protein